MIELKPTLILIDTPFRRSNTREIALSNPSPYSLPDPDEEPENHTKKIYTAYRCSNGLCPNLPIYQELKVVPVPLP